MKIDSRNSKKILVVYDFEILYVEGCGEWITNFSLLF
jgi:hypothetical protein